MSLHAKLIRERHAARYLVRPDGSGRPGYVAVQSREVPYGTGTLWQGHRDNFPSMYDGATDRRGLLSRPDTTD